MNDCHRWRACVRLVVLAAALALAPAVLGGLSGCAAAKFVGGAASNAEAQKLVEVNAKYDGLKHQTFAVLVQLDYATMFEHPNLVTMLTAGITTRIARFVEGAQMLDPQQVLEWQARNPQWNALPLGDLPKMLTVDRVVFVDVLEYRLNPPGNRWLWEGVAVSRVGIIERGGLDPDSFAESFDISAKFPNIEAVPREAANQAQMEAGLLSEFVKRNAWLFHYHLEPKHPDKYNASQESKDIKEKKRVTGS